MNSTKLTYKWKMFSLGGYQALKDDLGYTFQISDLDFRDVSTCFENYSIIQSFTENYSSFQIARESKKLIDNLIIYHKLATDSVVLYALAAILQKDFSSYYDNPVNTSKGEFADAEFLHLELMSLFNLVEIHLNNAPLEKFENITFKFKDKEMIFKSVFIFKDLFESFIKHLNITKENFEEIKREKLSDVVNVKFDKLAEFHKLKYITGLYNFISDSEKITNKNLKFVGAFLLLSQIPISSLADEIIVPSDRKDIRDPDIKNLRSYVQGNKKHSHKS